MKLLVFSDLHSSITGLRKLQETIKKEKPDVLINLGDFTVFEQNLEQTCAQLKKLHPRQIVLHGNHEDELTVDAMCRHHKWVFAHKKLTLIDNILFVGWGGEGFSHDIPEFIKWVLKNKKVIDAAQKIVLLTHQPPYGTILDSLWGDHVGNRSFTTFIKNSKPLLALSGHIHETAGKMGKIGKTTLINPGPYGKVITI